MHLLAPSYARLKRLLAPSYARLFPRDWKHRSEFRFWRWWLSENGHVGNSWYEPLYTDVYGLTTEDFKDKRILDIGCGPCGSLEWANMAARRVGLDPLARKYQQLVGQKHKMEYVTAPSERIPFPDAYFDVLSCLNALDHVDDFDTTVREIKRVVKRGGLFLLSVEIDHRPTATEPIVINDLALRKFGPEFETATSFQGSLACPSRAMCGVKALAFGRQLTIGQVATKKARLLSPFAIL
jgi:SAM-dependent methyltransferase